LRAHDTGLSVACRVFSVAKRGEAHTTNEDATDYDLEALRFAIADGVSQSTFPQAWARILAREFVERPATPTDLRQWLFRPRHLWEASIDWKAVEGSLPEWFSIEDMQREMAHATLVGLCLEAIPQDARGMRWTALVVGDSCLFQVRTDRMVRAVPFYNAAGFHGPLSVLSSKAGTDELVAHWAEGEGIAGDVFFLASDALARWFLSANAKGLKPWSLLANIKCQETYAAAIAKLRDHEGLEDDDTTCLMVQLNQSA
jgi:hypothetical protein